MDSKEIVQLGTLTGRYHPALSEKISNNLIQWVAAIGFIFGTKSEDEYSNLVSLR